MANSTPSSKQQVKDNVSKDDETSEAEAKAEGVEEGEPEVEEEEKKKEKPPIPEDFYYDANDYWRSPRKSDDSLPNNLVVLYHSFGYPCHLRHNLHALDTSRMAFAAGGYLQIVKHEKTKFSYDYLPTTGGGSIGALALHPSGQQLAVAERGVTPVINIFDTLDFKLYRILREGTTKVYTAVIFNDSGDLLASQGGDPDFMLTVWNWKQEAIMLRCKSFAQEVNHVSFNKDMQGELTTAGSGHIKFWQMAYTFTGLKLKGAVGRFGKTALSDIEGYIEFPDGKVLSGSDWGNLLLWDENLIKIQISRKNGKPCHFGPIMHMLMVEGEIITAGTDGFVRSWNLELIDGLETGEESGTVEIEAMNEVMIGHGAKLFHLTRPPAIFHRKSVTSVTSLEKAQQHGSVEKAQQHGSVEKAQQHGSGSFDDLPSKHNWYIQDGSGAIWMADLSFNLAAKQPKCMLRFHAGAVVACAVSPITHLVMTLGEDGCLRLHDFLKKTLLASTQFKAKGTSLTWIPVSVDRKCATVLAGFSDGGIRRVAIDITPDPEANREQGTSCSLKLMAAFRPHEKAVTCVAYSRYGGEKSNELCVFLATASEDKTIFFFQVLSEDNYNPWCFILLDSIPRQIHWSSEEVSGENLMIACDESTVIEMFVPVIVDTRETLKVKHVRMRVYKIPSVKSEFLHEEIVKKESEQLDKLQKQREQENKELIEKGLETASQQNLRLESEKAVAELARREKEDLEEQWKPYIPSVPSNILQIVYSEPDSKFWVALSDYDVGFLYEYQFNVPILPCTDQQNPSLDTSDPVRIVRVTDAEEEPITAMCFNSDGTIVFLGFKNGTIRLQFLDNEYDLGAVRSHWSVGVHDVVNGALMDMKLSHDELFLITVGADGNVFIFCLVTPEQLKHDVNATEAVIPQGTCETPGQKPVSDLAPSQYTIEQAKQKSEHDKLLAQAETNKQHVRHEISNLRILFKKLVTLNHQMPPEHRLTKDEFIMDHDRQEEIMQELDQNVHEVLRQMAWDTEKITIGFKKLKDHYLKGLKTDHFCVHALGTGHNIWSYRVREDVVWKKMKSGAQGKLMKSRPDSQDETGDDSLKEYIESMEAVIRAIMQSTTDGGCIQFMAQRTAGLLKKCNALRIKRARRKIVWRQFLATKPHDDYEDPADVEAIREAKQTMGFRTLKNDPQYTVADSYKLDKDSGCFRLAICDHHLMECQSTFNKKLLALRDEKVDVVQEIEHYCARLNKINEKLQVSKQKPIPACPQMQPEEQPELRHSLNSNAKKQLQAEAHKISATWTASFLKQLTQVSSMALQGERRKSLFDEKGKRKTSFSIAKENYNPMVSPHMEINIKGFSSKTPLSMHEVVTELSPLQLEMLEIEQIHLEYQQDFLLKKIKACTRAFDIKHRQLRHEKFALDLIVKQGELRSNTLGEEYLLLTNCQAVEHDIQSRIDLCTEQKQSVDRDVRNLTAQINKLGKELDELSKKDSELYQQACKVIGDTNAFRDFLLKVYKKKVKRKKVTEDGTPSHSESSGESSDDDDMDDEDDEEGESMQLDLNVCPPKCSQQVYDEVVDLRSKRLDNDDNTVELKRQKEALLKELEGIGKKKQAAEATLAKAEKELEIYQLEKQKMVNALDVVIMLQMHQIQCLKRNNQIPCMLKEEICINEREVLRLQNRIRELQQEKKDMKKAMAERRKHFSHLVHERGVFQEKMAKMEEEVNSQMVKKFGRMVNLEEVEVVPADNFLEDVRARLHKTNWDCAAEIKDYNRKLSRIQYDRIHQLRICSEYTMLEATQKALKFNFEQSLDKSLKCSRVSMIQDSPANAADIKLLSEVCAEQRDVIHALHTEIQFLVKGDMMEDEFWDEMQQR